MKIPVRLSAAVVCLILTWGLATPSSHQATTEAARERWNKEFAGPLPNLNRNANALLVSVIKGKTPGRALDLGVGEGRNAIYLARNGWSVTGVDLSEVAVAQAKQNAAANKAQLTLHVSDLDVFDFGKEQWDLIISTYMHAWHDRSKTDVPARIYDALKPGGLLVMEAFAKPEVAFGFSPLELARQYSRFRILHNEDVNAPADWDKNNTRHLVKFVGQKPTESAPQEWFDSSVRPQDNFFQYVNGGWLARMEIPSDRSSYGVWNEIQDRVRDQLTAIIAAPERSDSLEIQKLRNFYRSVMDEGRIEGLGLKPLAAELAVIDGMKSQADFARALARLWKLEVALPLVLTNAVDAKNPTRLVAVISQGGLGLPNRDYYVGDSGVAQYREHYTAYLTKIFDVIGSAQSATSAREVFAVENRLADHHWTAVASRDRLKTYNRFTRADLKNKMAGFDWDVWFTELGVPHDAEFVVSQPSFVEAFAHLAATYDVSQWKPYLKAALVSRYAPFLHSDLAVPHFELYSKALEGATTMRPRSERAVDATSALLPWLVGKAYVERHFSDSAKIRMDALVEQLRGALRESIETSPWMSPETREAALEKLTLFLPNIGYPAKWIDYSTVFVDSSDLVGNVMRAIQFQRADLIRRIGTTVDRSDWPPRMAPQIVNASYVAGRNTINFPAAILQPPYFDVNGDDAANYGAIGAVIGHEMGHGFDDQGRRSDGRGMLRDWWTPADAEAYQRRAAVLVAQYDNYEALPGLKVNGKLTLGENIGDLTGVSIALRAYHRSLSGRPAPIVDGLTGDQRFFIAWARVWRMKDRDDYARKLIVMDPHAPPAFRANGPLSHIPEFYEAFSVKPGDGMDIAPERRIKIF